MPLYEHVYLARQDLSAQQVEELTTQLSGVIGQMGGKVTKNELTLTAPTKMRVLGGGPRSVRPGCPAGRRLCPHPPSRPTMRGEAEVRR